MEILNLNWFDSYILLVAISIFLDIFFLDIEIRSL